MTTNLEDRALYVNRELAWLAFNARVLDQAGDARWPLLERVKFLAIFASNLDEFFMIRVAGLHEQLEAAVVEKTADGLTVKEQLAEIRAIVQTQVAIASARFASDLSPALAANGIHVHRWDTLDAPGKERARSYFDESVYPLLTPLAVDPVHPFPFVSNLSLSLAVEAVDPETRERKFARVKVPESLPRFVSLDLPDASLGSNASSGDAAKLDLIPLEELIAHNLDTLFPGMEILGCHPFRVTRDMDLEILEDEADDLLAVVDREIGRRRFGAAVRLELGPAVPARIRGLLLRKLEIEEDDLYESPSPLGLAALSAIAFLPRSDLRDPPLAAQTPSAWSDHRDPFAAISAGDILLHHPYDAFAPVLDFLRCAADDPNVLAIKMTLYRAGSSSETVRALVRAAEKGKQVAVSIELKARFDEENNVGWARALERAGVHVFYGAAGLKTHAKALLVVRREGARLRRYVHLSTGNYNASTAKIYTDTGLFTADEAIGEDASQLFNALSGFSRNARYRKLAVAPVTLRRTLLEKIEAQAARCLEGKRGYIFAKLNALVDTAIIRALYGASQAGVTIDLVVRGVCCLRPGIPGVSDHIRVRSLIGRFLEHERVFVFGPPGDDEVYLASADWMPRNLDRRVEVLFPITSEAIREQIRRECLSPIEVDNSRVYEMQADGSYQKRMPARGEAEIDAQVIVSRIAADHAASRKRNGAASDSKIVAARVANAEA